MKLTGIAFLLSMTLLAAISIQPTDLLQEIRRPDAGYSSEWAKELGADNYGMKKYVMAFLKAGPKRDLDETETIKLQKAHLENIVRMAKEGKLLVAGPFLDRGEVRGIYVFNVESIEEAKKLTETDPAVQAGTLTMELHPWFGSAAMQLVTDLHRRGEKESVAK